MAEALPLTYAPACSAGNDVEHGEEACSVCLAVMCGEEKVMHLSCGHTFHCACISSWLLHQQASAKEMSCPVCRGAASPRQCCENAWTELDLKSQPRENKDPTSEELVRRAAARDRSGLRLYLLVLTACVAVVVLLGSSSLGEYSQQMGGSGSSSEGVIVGGRIVCKRIRCRASTTRVSVAEWQLMGNRMTQTHPYRRPDLSGRYWAND